MGKNGIKIYIDPYGNTLNMWWGNPKDASISEESKEALDVIIKNKKGKAIGLEKIGFFPPEISPLKYLEKRIGFLLETKKGLSA
jgi:hypothetical protein